MAGKTIQIAVDRIEGEWVVLQVAGGSTLEFPRDLLPSGIREGMHLLMTITENPSAEDSQKSKIQALHQQLKNQG